MITVDNKGIDSLRSRCNDWVDSLPPELLDLSLIIDRDLLVGSDSFFGVFYAFILADLYGIKDENLINSIGFSAFLLRGFVVIQDTIVDENTEININLTRLSSLFLIKALEIQSKLSNNKDLYWQHANEIFLDFASANTIEENLHRRKYSPYQLEDYLRFGTKTGLIKMPIITMSLSQNNIELYKPVASAMTYALIGAQMIDDLLDWKLDLNNGLINHVATRAIKHIIQERNSITNELHDLSILEIEKILIGMRIYEKILVEINKYFNLAIELLIEYSNSIAVIHWKAINNRNNRLIQSLRDIEFGPVETLNHSEFDALSHKHNQIINEIQENMFPKSSFNKSNIH